MGYWGMLIIGLMLMILGIVNLKGKIGTIHAYNRRRVRPEDAPKYGKAVGTGTLVIGAALVAAFGISFWSEGAVAFIILPACAVGLGFILYGQFKYNGGLF